MVEKLKKLGREDAIKIANDATKTLEGIFPQLDDRMMAIVLKHAAWSFREKYNKSKKK